MWEESLLISPSDLLLGDRGWPPSPGWLSNQMQMGLQEKVPPVLKMLGQESVRAAGRAEHAEQWCSGSSQDRSRAQVPV